MSVEALQAVVNVGAIGVVCLWLMFRADKTIRELTRQIRLNTLLLAHLSKGDMREIEKMDAAGGDTRIR